MPCCSPARFVECVVVQRPASIDPKHRHYSEPRGQNMPCHHAQGTKLSDLATIPRCHTAQCYIPIHKGVEIEVTTCTAVSVMDFLHPSPASISRCCSYFDSCPCSNFSAFGCSTSEPTHLATFLFLLHQRVKCCLKGPQKHCHGHPPRFPFFCPLFFCIQALSLALYSGHQIRLQEERTDSRIRGRRSRGDHCGAPTS